MTLKKDVLFLLQEHNSIDHVTPLVELLYKNKYNITLIKTLHDYNYNNNHINYLSKNCPKIDIKDLFLDTNIRYMKLHNLYNLINLNLSRQKFFINKSILYFLRAIVRKIIHYFGKIKINDVEKIFEKYDKNNLIVLADISNGDYNYPMLVNYIKLEKIKLIAFNHGLRVLVNELQSYSQLNFAKNDSSHSNLLVDNIVVYDKLALKSFSKDKNKNVIKMPSLRFTSEWIETLKDFYPEFKVQNEEKYKLKIVFMLSGMVYNTWEDEQYRTIQAIVRNEDILLVVKVHPRDIRVKNQYLKIPNKNLHVVDNQISSTSLINWADIVMNTGSGIIMEALIKKKIIFYMKYLHCNLITPEETKRIMHVINTRDDLLNLINHYRDNVTTGFFDEEERKGFLKEYISNDDFNENKVQYLKWFESLNEK